MFIKRLKNKWEGICNQCGQCCYEKSLLPDNTVIVNYKKPCEHLDEDNHLCHVYSRRFLVCKSCKKVTLYHALFASYMPEDCAYVVKFRFWRKRKNRNKNLETDKTIRKLSQD